MSRESYKNKLVWRFYDSNEGTGLPFILFDEKILVTLCGGITEPIGEINTEGSVEIDEESLNIFHVETPSDLSTCGLYEFPAEKVERILKEVEMDGLNLGSKVESAKTRVWTEYYLEEDYNFHAKMFIYNGEKIHRTVSNERIYFGRGKVYLEDGGFLNFDKSIGKVISKDGVVTIQDMRYKFKNKIGNDLFNYLNGATIEGKNIIPRI